MNLATIPLALAFALLLLSACGGSSPLPAAHASTPRLVVVFGDSLTAGMMPVGGYVQARQDLAWTREVWATGAQVVTAAVGGQRTGDAATLQLSRLRGLPATHVVVLLGINDAVHRVPLTDAVRNVGAILDAYPAARPILIAPTLWSEDTRAWQSAWRDQLALMAVIRGGVFVDAYTAAQPGWWCHADRHPCPEGHRAIGALVAAALGALA